MIKPNLTCKLLAEKAVQVWLGFIIFTWVNAPTVHVAMGNNTFDHQFGPVKGPNGLLMHICLTLVIIDFTVVIIDRVIIDSSHY